MEYLITLDHSTEPVQSCAHFIEIEANGEIFELKIKEIVYDIHNADFQFDDFDEAEKVAKLLGIETDTLMDEIIDIIYKSS